MRNQCAGSVCGSVHGSWRQEKRDSIVYTNSEKDKQISISSSPKYIATQASHIVWEIRVRVVCMVLYTAHGNRVREMRSLYKLRKRETGLDLILSKNLLRYKDRILCEKSVCSWCGFCTQLMATWVERCDRYINSEKVRQISISFSPTKNIAREWSFIVRSWCVYSVCGFCTQLMATRERCDWLHKFSKTKWPQSHPLQ